MSEEPFLLPFISAWSEAFKSWRATAFLWEGIRPSLAELKPSFYSVFLQNLQSQSRNLVTPLSGLRWKKTSLPKQRQALCFRILGPVFFAVRTSVACMMFWVKSEMNLWKGQTATWSPVIEQGFPDIVVFCTCMGVRTGRCAGHWACVTPGKVEGNCKCTGYLKTKSMVCWWFCLLYFTCILLLTKSSLEGNSLLLIFNFLLLL